MNFFHQDVLVDGFHLPCHKVENALEGCDKQAFAVGAAEQFVDFREDLTQIRTGFGVVAYQRLADHHEEGGRHAFSRNVCNHNGEMRLVHHKEVVEVAAPDLNLLITEPDISKRIITGKMLFEASLFFVFPRALIMLGLSSICTTVAGRTRRLLEKQIRDSEERQRISLSQ